MKKLIGALLVVGAVASNTSQILHTTIGLDTDNYIADVTEDVRSKVVTVTSVPDSGNGSGVVVLDGTYIITNKHVADAILNPSPIEEAVAKALGIKDPLPPKHPVVITADGRTISGEFVCVSKVTDLALLKIKGKLPVAHLGGKVKEFKKVIAVGSPSGMTDVVTYGRIVKFLSESISHRLEGFNILHTADLNPGNSGGGLFDFDGNLLGINVAIVTTLQGINNVSIGAETVNKFLVEECGK